MGKEEIIERLEEIAKHAVHVLGEKPFFMSLDDGIAIHEAIDILKSAQPEIIYCKDCTNWDTTWTNDWTPNYHYCPIIDGVRKDDFYCADAERRTDEAD